jgi:hypothetical protein
MRTTAVTPAVYETMIETCGVQKSPLGREQHFTPNRDVGFFKFLGTERVPGALGSVLLIDALPYFT